MDINVNVNFKSIIDNDSIRIDIIKINSYTKFPEGNEYNIDAKIYNKKRNSTIISHNVKYSLKRSVLYGLIELTVWIDDIFELVKFKTIESDLPGSRIDYLEHVIENQIQPYF